MSEHTKGKASAKQWYDPNPKKTDLRWTIMLDGAVRFITDGDNDEANAKEFVRRWNAFEDGGIVEELRTVSHNLTHTMGIDYAIKKLSVSEDTMAVGASVILAGIQRQAKIVETKLEAALAKI